MLTLSAISAILILCGNILQVKANENNLLINLAESSTQYDEQVQKITDEMTYPNLAMERLDLRSASQRKFPSNCDEALRNFNVSGIYTIQVDSYGPTPFQVYCEAKAQGGGWTVIQRRQDGSTNFYRSMALYKKGFGFLEGEFFIGLDKLHAMTSETPNELLIEMEDFAGNLAYARYDLFAISGEDEQYALNILGLYSGTAGDSLLYQKFMPFSTFDSDTEYNCAALRHGAWWYDHCNESNLNGVYFEGAYTKRAREGIEWLAWTGKNYSLKFVHMLIRPKLY